MVDFYKTNLYRLIAVVIDKQQHHAKYGDDAMHPYHFAVESLVERFCHFLRKRQATGEVFADRGKAEDKLLVTEWEKFRKNGTRFIDAKQLCELIPNPELNFRTKPQNITGIQLTDMLAYTMAHNSLIEYGERDRFKNRFEKIVAEAIAEKYDRDSGGGAKGYGKVLLSGPE